MENSIFIGQVIPVRSFSIEGVYWFSAIDFLKALNQSSQDINKDDSELLFKMKQGREIQSVNDIIIINSMGIFYLLLESMSFNAQRFRKLAVTKVKTLWKTKDDYHSNDKIFEEWFKKINKSCNLTDSGVICFNANKGKVLKYPLFQVLITTF